MSLPRGYRRLEYIKSNGTQWIDTGCNLKNDSKVVLDCDISYSSGSKWDMIFGAYDSSAWFSWWANGGYINAYYGSEVEKTTAPSGRITLIADGNNWTANGTTMTINASTFTAPSTAYIFSIHNGGSYTNASMKLYSCQIYDGETIIRDFVPCINASGDVGLYDLVGKQFYGNAGTGTFTAGSVIAIAADKSEITKLEYIQSSGTQWIDTGAKAKNDTKVIADCEITYGTGWVKILGSYEAGASFSWWANASNIYAYYGTEGKPGVGATGKHILTANGNMWSDSVNDFAFSYSSFTATRNMYLFSVNGGGTYDNSPMKLFFCQIYDNGTIIRDYIPAKLSDGTIGLYDKLNGLLYINAGTGTFEAGPSSLNLPVNIGGTWKDANEVFVNIGGTWKAVETAFVNIGGTWKELG